MTSFVLGNLVFREPSEWVCTVNDMQRRQNKKSQTLTSRETYGARVVNNNDSLSSFGAPSVVDTFAAAKIAFAEVEFLWRYCEFSVSIDGSSGVMDDTASVNSALTVARSCCGKEVAVRHYQKPLCAMMHHA